VSIAQRAVKSNSGDNGNENYDRGSFYVRWRYPGSARNGMSVSGLSRNTSVTTVHNTILLEIKGSIALVSQQHFFKGYLTAVVYVTKSL